MTRGTWGSLLNLCSRYSFFQLIRDTTLESIASKRSPKIHPQLYIGDDSNGFLGIPGYQRGVRCKAPRSAD